MGGMAWLTQRMSVPLKVMAVEVVVCSLHPRTDLRMEYAMEGSFLVAKVSAVEVNLVS